MKEKQAKAIELYSGAAVLLCLLASLGMVNDGLRRIAAHSYLPMLLVTVGLWLGAEHKGEPRRALRFLLLPYLWFSLFITAAVAAASLLHPAFFRSYEEIVSRLCMALIGGVTLSGGNGLWLLPAIAVALLLWYSVRDLFSLRVSVLLVVLLAFVFLILATVLELQITELAEPLTFQGIAMRIVCVLWRGVLALPYLLWGMGLRALEPRLGNRTGLRVGIGVAAVAAGAVLAYASTDFAPMYFRYGKPWFSVPASLLLSGGFYLICCWIGVARPVNFLGRYALILYLALTEFGILPLAERLGLAVFRRWDHNFGMRATVLLITLLLAALSLLILRLPALSFLYGGRDLNDRKRKDRRP